MMCRVRNVVRGDHVKYVFPIGILCSKQQDRVLFAAELGSEGKRARAGAMSIRHARDMFRAVTGSMPGVLVAGRPWT
jgi:hypothetical protein